MIFESVEDIKKVLEASKRVPDFIQYGRDYSTKLKALIDGTDFKDLLLKIEHIEHTNKAAARKKYARSIKDFYHRMLNPINNIYSSTGGSKEYDIQNDTIRAKLFQKISNIRDNRSLEAWLKDNWMHVYHTDPMGSIFLEYTEETIYPTYKSINAIRNYKQNGQLVDWVVFEPVKRDVSGQIYSFWRVVDDVRDYMFVQRGDDFFEVEDETYDHPFGRVPLVINSNIGVVGEEVKKSPIDTIVELSEEYLRDQSIKTIYKFLHGFPIHWRYVMQCPHCKGTGKNGVDQCTYCDGQGVLIKKDVTDIATIPLPTKDEQKIAPDIAGYVSPDLDTWDKYNLELRMLEDVSFDTHWGTTVDKGDNETATGRFIDVQPVINKLNDYADVAEWVEWQLTEWIITWVDQGRDTTESKSSISYGRRFIIEPPDVILEKYEKAKENGDNTTVLDRLFNEYLTSKYKNDPDNLRSQLTKANIEPYIHYNIDQVSTIFGLQEAQKKVLFRDWWESLDMNTIKEKNKETLSQDYETWVNSKLISNNEN